MTARAKFGLYPTVLAAGAALGATTVKVQDITGYSSGDTIRLNPGGPNEERRAISGTPSGNTLTLSTPLLYAHARDEVVHKPTNPTTTTFKVEDPQGQNVSYTGGQLSNPAIGDLTLDFTVNRRGTWKVESSGVGAVQKRVQGELHVLGAL